MTEQQLREQLRKISALYEGATTPENAAPRRRPSSGSRRPSRPSRRPSSPPNYQFTLPDLWQRRLFWALCRRYGLEPFRYKRQRYTTVMVRAPKTFVDRTLWPEYQQLREALNRYLNQATDRIIREEVYGDIDEGRAR
jgi:hypothetical protein